MAGAAKALRDRAITDPEGFWGDAAQLIDWYQEPRTVLDTSAAPATHWFPDGTLNTCFNAVDRHVRDGRGDQRAICYDSPVQAPSARSPMPRCWTRLRGSPVGCGGWVWARATGF